MWRIWETRGTHRSTARSAAASAGSNDATATGSDHTPFGKAALARSAAPRAKASFSFAKDASASAAVFCASTVVFLLVSSADSVASPSAETAPAPRVSNGDPPGLAASTPFTTDFVSVDFRNSAAFAVAVRARPPERGGLFGVSAPGLWSAPLGFSSPCSTAVASTEKPSAGALADAAAITAAAHRNARWTPILR